MNLWLLGRQQTLFIHGAGHCLERVERMMDDYLWQTWPGFYGVEFQEVANEEEQLVVEAQDFKIIASPVDHLVPTIGLRFEGPGKTAVYSCDTAPCRALVRLARGADVLIHEASGESPGHSSARQAGEVASQAGAERLLLIHYPRLELDDEAGFLAQSQESFAGKVGLARDWMRIEL
jgi:ribonuclease Z